jgi:hypothetical protein
MLTDRNMYFEWLKFIYIYINVWKSSQRMNLRDVGSETSVNDSVQTNNNDTYTFKMLSKI